MEQLIAHALGDYVLQSDFMAQQKIKKLWVAVLHAVTYGLPFLILCTPSLYAWLVIVSTHAVIDRWRLAKYVVFAKNFLAPPSEWPKWEDCKDTGYHKDRPPWMAVWLLIVADNTLHMLVNWLALRQL